MAPALNLGACAAAILLVFPAPAAPMSAAVAFAQAGSPAQEPAPVPAGQPAPAGRYDGALDVLHYDIELGLGHAADWVGGHTRIWLTAREPSTRLILDLTGLAVDSVTVDARALDGWTLEEGLLTVPFPGALAPGDSVWVGVRYRGVPDDGLILGANVHRERTAFADNWPNRARFWFPSVDHPSDKATVRYMVHAPESWAVVANGRLVGQPFPTADDAPGPHDGPRRSWVWTTDVPTPTYTMVVGAGPLVVDDVGTAACGRAPASPRPDGCIEVTTWLFAPDVETGARSFRRAAEMVDFFADVVGSYPYEKLAHVQSSTRFGGMENSSAIFYADEALAQGRDIEGTVSHETAHQWFGDSVTPASWEHLWLSEGFATYFGALFFEYADGPEALQRLMAGAARSYLTSPDTLHATVDTTYASLFDLLNANSYQKGSWVLHMLRDLIGDEVFFEGVRTYYDRHRDGTAVTPDLLAAMEEVSGHELGWFFRQWLYEAGHPVLDVALEGPGDAEGSLRVRVRQMQAEHGHVFRFPLELEFTLDGGRHRERIEVTAADEVFTVSMPGEARGVSVDPDGKLLKRLIGRPDGGG